MRDSDHDISQDVIWRTEEEELEIEQKNIERYGARIYVLHSGKVVKARSVEPPCSVGCID